ncbi:hypothetical protein [Azospirillum soli]|uniref:hypothetical protein n=1 Tax=Azospirillum soli TaxID=1304799 RepID=UPI001AEAD07C|nr:hypothetical protein [Azospirillum soli]MBP2314763.1 hypothetical protein [Azospirillum soli]
MLRSSERSEKHWVRHWVLRPVVTTVAVLYFLIDAVVFGVIRPFAAWVGSWPVFARVARWVAGLGPYPTLVLFLVPLVVLEPAKPLGLYLMGTGHALEGVVVIGTAEVLKITLVERLFHMSRDKLLTIPAFAWGYVRVVRWLDWLKALPAWQAVLRAWRRVAEAARSLTRAVRGWAWRFAKKG